MYQEDVKWFNQTLLSYKDNRYSSEGFLRVSISTSTSDYSSFNPPNLLISIKNNYQKFISLDFTQAMDLIQTFDKIINSLKGNGGFKDFQIDRKIKGTMLVFNAMLNKDYNEIIVKTQIYTNDTDLRVVIAPLQPVFQSFIKCLRYYVDNYFQLCTSLLMKSIDSPEREIINQLPSLIKGVSANITQVNNLDYGASEPIPNGITEDDISKVAATTEDLDKFLGEGMGNIKIPEIEVGGKVEETAAPVEIYSPFTEKVLKGNLKTLEDMLRNASMGSTPILDLANEFEKRLDLDEKFKMLPNLNNEDSKSLLYLSKLFSSLAYQNNLVNDTPIPPTNPILRYNPADYTPDNVEIAYELFVYGIYVRCVRRKLEDKISDAEHSKALFHIYFRCFLDPFVFSYLRKDNKLLSICVSRFTSYDKDGVFDYYKKMLESNGLGQITEREIAESVNEANEKALSSGQLIADLHKQAAEAKKVRVTAENNFSLEQITNEIVPLEVLEKTGKSVSSVEEISKILPEHKFSKDILDFFLKSKPVSKKKETKNNNLTRIILRDKDDIPEKYRDDFVEFLNEFTEKKFDFNQTKFPLDEFGENLIKALYVWDPIGNPIMKTNYKQFFVFVEDEIMTKELILSKIKGEDEVKESNNSWNFDEINLGE